MALTPSEQELANVILSRSFEDARQLQSSGVALTPIISYACQAGPKDPLYKAVIDYMDQYGDKIEINTLPKDDAPNPNKYKPRGIQH